MKLNKIILLLVLCVVMFVFIFSACGDNTTVNNETTVNDEEVVVNTSSVNENKPTPALNKKTPEANVNKNSDEPPEKSVEKTAGENSEADIISGELQLGKTDSVILYVGMETGDYAAYCFVNDSDAGRKVLAVCKDKEQCEVKATIDMNGGCEVPGLEAGLSGSGKILKVNSAKSLGRQK